MRSGASLENRDDFGFHDRIQPRGRCRLQRRIASPQRLKYYHVDPLKIGARPGAVPALRSIRNRPPGPSGAAANSESTRQAFVAAMQRIRIEPAGNTGFRRARGLCHPRLSDRREVAARSGRQAPTKPWTRPSMRFCRPTGSAGRRAACGASGWQALPSAGAGTGSCRAPRMSRILCWSATGSKAGWPPATREVWAPRCSRAGACRRSSRPNATMCLRGCVSRIW